MNIRFKVNGDRVTILNRGFYVEYKPCGWVIKCNPMLHLPAKRKNSEKRVYLNSKKVGTIAFYNGIPPIYDEDRYEPSLRKAFSNWFKHRTGLFCKNSERGYWLCSLKKHDELAVTEIYDDDKCIAYAVTIAGTKRRVGCLSISYDCLHVTTAVYDPQYKRAIYIISGYLLEESIRVLAKSLFKWQVEMPVRSI